MKTSVYVFQTSVMTEKEVNTLKESINNLREIKRWNFDLSDPGLLIFRIEAFRNVSRDIISMFNRFGFICMELTSGKRGFERQKNDINSKLFKVGIMTLLLSGIVFWVGAFTPPYKQWMASDVTEYLSIINNNETNWYAIHTLFTFGVIGSFAAMVILSVAFRDETSRALALAAAGIYGLGVALVIINFAFRLSVTLWAAHQLAERNELEASFQTWMDWSNILFAVYMMAGYFSCLFLGLAIRRTTSVPQWVVYFWILFGAIALIIYPTRFLFFEPPLMIHLPFIVGPIGILLMKKPVAAEALPKAEKS